MATIRKRGNKYQGIVRRSGWPQQSASFLTKVKTERWCRAIESNMDEGVFADQSNAKNTTLSDLMEIYLSEVTALRRRKQSRQVESYIINRILREEKALCGMKLNKLKPAHFINYRDRRLLQCPKNQIASNDNPKTIAPSTINRELSVLKCMVDNRIRKLGLPYNPVNGRDVKRLAVNDERDLRLTPEEIQRLAVHEVYVEETQWYSSGGVEESAGGYHKNSKRWRELTLTGPFSLDDLKLQTWVRRASSLSHYNWPNARLAHFV